MDKFRVLVLGAYGFFGSRLTQRLARHPQVHLMIAGRSIAKGQALLQLLAVDAKASLEALAVDASAPSLASNLKVQNPHVLINAAGPFQGCDYSIPLACIEAGIHYVDLADARNFVCGIASLDAIAKAAGVVVLSGASSVPALSSAAADTLTSDLAAVCSIDIGISPGNRTERGLSTVRGILSYCGKPLPTVGKTETYGWAGVQKHLYPPPVGSRLLSPCDVPDLTLFPKRFPGTPMVRFSAGLELQFLHRGMNLMAWMAKARWVDDWSRHAGALKLAGDLFRYLGSEAGAMHVQVKGRGNDGASVTRTWHLIAENGDGPFVPTLAAAALVLKLQKGTILPGANPCVGYLTLDDFALEMAGLAIRTELKK
ncbi:saccharopine dehydrogenase [Xylophilus sp. Kf1]|nr:saccharopine dehydrogenase [Xylophilus sp. Kf1]